MEIFSNIPILVVELTLIIIAFKGFRLNNKKYEIELNKEIFIVLDEIERIGISLKNYFDEEIKKKNTIKFNINQNWRERIASLNGTISIEGMNYLFEIYNDIEKYNRTKLNADYFQKYIQWENYIYIDDRKEIIYIYQFEMVRLYSKLKKKVKMLDSYVTKDNMYKFINNNKYEIKNIFDNNSIKQKIKQNGDLISDFSSTNGTKTGHINLKYDTNKHYSKYFFGNIDLKKQGLFYDEKYFKHSIIDIKVNYEENILCGKVIIKINDKVRIDGEYEKGILINGKINQKQLSREYLNDYVNQEYLFSDNNEKINDKVISINKPPEGDIIYICETIDCEVVNGEESDIIDSKKNINVYETDLKK